MEERSREKKTQKKNEVLVKRRERESARYLCECTRARGLKSYLSLGVGHNSRPGYSRAER